MAVLLTRAFEMVFIILLLLALAVFAIFLFCRLHNYATDALCTSLKNLEGKTAIITGGTTGMGLEIATDLARRGARVIIACPFKEEGVNANKIIQARTGSKQIVFKLLDLGSFESVRGFAADILKTEERLDLLINNAGVGMPRNFKTKDGLNFIMQVNYYGHFLLTILLLPLLKKTGTFIEPARIVVTSSRLHYFGRVDLNSSSINQLNFFSYCNSKFCLIPFSRELARRLKGTHVVINSVNPGTIGTGIFNCAGILGAVWAKLLVFCNKTAKMGAQTALHVALDKYAGRVSGEYFENCRQAQAIFRAYEQKTAISLWEESVRLVRLTKEELENSLK